MTQLQKTRAALAAYYADIPRRDALWVLASNEAGLHAAREADDAALLALRTVFAEETAGINTTMTAMSATAREIRQAVGMTDDEASTALVSAFIDDMQQEADNRVAWALGDYTGQHCTNCGRQRVCLCPNGKHRCEKCNWSPDLADYAPVNT